MATGSGDWFTSDSPAARQPEAITRNDLTDQALAASLTRLQSGETSGLLGKVNASLSPDSQYDRGTLIAASALAAFSLLLFAAGALYSLT